MLRAALGFLVLLRNSNKSTDLVNHPRIYYLFAQSTAYQPLLHA